MRLRPYRKKDTEFIQNWITDEESHVKWCAGRLPFGFTAEQFVKKMEEDEAEWGDCAFTATDDAGKPAGFFKLSINEKENTGFLKFIIVDNRERGRGLGGQMLVLAARYASEIAGLKALSLIVFDENTAAAACYKKAGFRPEQEMLPPFEASGKSWKRTKMTLHL